MCPTKKFSVAKRHISPLASYMKDSKNLAKVTSEALLTSVRRKGHNKRLFQTVAQNSIDQSAHEFEHASTKM